MNFIVFFISFHFNISTYLICEKMRNRLFIRMRRSITIILSIHIHFFSNYRYSLSQIHAFNFVPQVRLRGRGHNWLCVIRLTNLIINGNCLMFQKSRVISYNMDYVSLFYSCLMNRYCIWQFVTTLGYCYTVKKT